MMDFDSSRWDKLLSALRRGERVVKALALDYDETLSFPGGLLRNRTAKALKDFAIETGCQLFLVSGRPFHFLADKAEKIRVDGFVAENGAIIYDDQGGKEFLTDDTRIVKFLKGEEIDGLQIKERIVELPEHGVKDALRLLNSSKTPYRMEKNQGQAMLMPLEVSKERGLEKLLGRFHLSFNETITVGDGENDLAMMEKSLFSVAVANAAEVVKMHADYMSARSYGEGVLEFLDRLKEAWSS
ncbi:MAG: HAD family hydrolase [Nitrososphaerales archaeon]